MYATYLTLIPYILHIFANIYVFRSSEHTAVISLKRMVPVIKTHRLLWGRNWNFELCIEEVFSSKGLNNSSFVGASSYIEGRTNFQNWR